MNDNAKKEKTGAITIIAMVVLVLFPYLLSLFPLIWILGNDIEILSAVQDRIEKVSPYGGLDLLLIYVMGSLCVTLFVLIQTKTNNKSARKALRENMLLHVLQMPAYIIIGIESIICIITIFTMGISLVLMLFCGFSICVSGSFAMGGIWIAVREGMWSKGEAMLYSVLSFIVCADVIVAVIMYRKIKKLYGVNNFT